MARVLTIKERFQRKAPRVVKFGWQWLRAAARQHGSARPVFVVGSQRSGTRLPLMVMDRSPDIITYNEGSAPFFDRVLLKDNVTIGRLLARMPFPIVVLKPICESHRIIELLDAFPGSKAVWIYRNPRDTVNSAVAKWTTGRAHVHELATEDFAAAGWRAGGISREKLVLVRELYHDSLSPHAADAIMWYLRNGLFFDLELQHRPDVLLVKYEDLVTNPAEHFPVLFEFLECPFEKRFLKEVYSSSVHSRPFPSIPLKIASLCDALHAKLDETYVGARVARFASGRAQSLQALSARNELAQTR